MPWYGTKACKKKKLVSFSWLRNLKTKKYPFWRLDTIFSNLKQTNLQIVDNGGWHFTNLMTAKTIFTKLSNFFIFGASKLKSLRRILLTSNSFIKLKPFFFWI